MGFENDPVYDKQEKCCKRCGYIEYYNNEHGNTIASMSTVEMISKEPIVKMKCPNCRTNMQIYYQEHHRRFYKCWKCNHVDSNPVFYSSEQKDYAEGAK